MYDSRWGAPQNITPRRYFFGEKCSEVTEVGATSPCILAMEACSSHSALETGVQPYFPQSFPDSPEGAPHGRAVSVAQDQSSMEHSFGASCLQGRWGPGPGIRLDDSYSLFSLIFWRFLGLVPSPPQLGSRTGVFPGALSCSLPTPRLGPALLRG